MAEERNKMKSFKQFFKEANGSTPNNLGPFDKGIFNSTPYNYTGPTSTKFMRGAQQSDNTPSNNVVSDPSVLQKATDVANVKSRISSGDITAGSRYDVGPGKQDSLTSEPTSTKQTTSSPAPTQQPAPVATTAPKPFQFSNAAKTGKGTVSKDEFNSWKTQQNNTGSSYGDFLNAARGLTKKGGNS